ncbi:hypothetical protein CLIB1423_08S04984 [[Candida] railenensis]|uniref:Major facilitator superfamily (MFS) profile domain-containing protein n=1 Tax=[Candida] railenensis TaxID=45579 RepID=A0A9P0VYW4_9ASCO|nr:hypothetical protein CLIB1423_08S04984 [[Candida] railenensis]
MFRKTYKTYGITSIIALSGLLLGLEYSSLTAFLSSHQFIDYFGILSNWEQTMISSSNSIGAVAGCVICGSMLDSAGSILTLQIACFPWICGTIVAILSSNIYMVVSGRVLKGISMGFVSTILPVYVSETLPNSRRGSSLAIVQLSSTIGTLVLYYVGNIFQTHILNDFSFRYTWMVETFPTILLLVLSFFLPESPKWYASRLKWQEAAKTLDRLKNEDNSLEKGKRSLLGDRGYVLTAYTSEPSIDSGSYADLFRKKYWKYTMIGVTIQSLVQITGVTSVMYFFVYICEACGLRGEGKVWIVSSQFLIFCIFTIFPILLLDGCRRKDSLIFGFSLLSISFASIWLIILLNKSKISNPMLMSNSPFNWELKEEPASAVLALFLFLVAVYSSTISCVSWLYTGEIFPVLIRSKGTSICMCVSWVLNLCLNILVPMSLPYLKFWTFGIFAIVCFFASIITSKFPETRDLDYSKLETLFTSGKNKEKVQGVTNIAKLPEKVSENDGSDHDGDESIGVQRGIKSMAFNMELKQDENQVIGTEYKEHITEADKKIMKTLKNRNSSVIYQIDNSPVIEETTSSQEILTGKDLKSTVDRQGTKIDLLSSVTTSEDDDETIQVYTPLLNQDSVASAYLDGESNLTTKQLLNADDHKNNEPAYTNEKFATSEFSVEFLAISKSREASTPSLQDKNGDSYEPFALLRDDNNFDLSPIHETIFPEYQQFPQQNASQNNARFGSNINIMNTFSQAKVDDVKELIESEANVKKWRLFGKDSS